jgi:hypothetical protein
MDVTMDLAKQVLSQGVLNPSHKAVDTVMGVRE